MMNEVLFLLQVASMCGVVIAALWLGKEALVATICMLFVLANLFVVKQMTLFGLQVTCADVYVIGAVLGFNMLQEYFGRMIAHKTIWISFFISAVVTLYFMVHLQYLPNLYDTTQFAFERLGGHLPRLVAASFAAHIISQYVRLGLYAWAQQLTDGRWLIARNLAVTACEQAVDTILFTTLGLYGLVYSLPQVMLISFTIKLITIAATAPWLVLVRMVVGHFHE